MYILCPYVPMSGILTIVTFFLMLFHILSDFFGIFDNFLVQSFQKLEVLMAQANQLLECLKEGGGGVTYLPYGVRSVGKRSPT